MEQYYRTPAPGCEIIFALTTNLELQTNILTYLTHKNYFLEVDFAINDIFLLETIFPLPFMCVYIAIIDTILQVTLWHIDSACACACWGANFF